jgi:HEAT repeat protein
MDNLPAIPPPGDHDDAAAWINRLRDDRWFETSCRALVNLGEEAVPTVMYAFEHSRDREETENTMTVLRRMGNLAVVPLIESVERQPEAPLMMHAILLGRIGDPRGIEALLLLLRNKSSLTRAAAVEALCQIGDRRAVVDVIQRLRDRSSDVAYAAAIGLADFGDPGAIPELERMLSKPSIRRYPGIVLAAEDAITKIKQRHQQPA